MMLNIFFLSFLFTASVGCNHATTAKSIIVQADSIYTYATPSTDGIGKFYLGREIAHVMGAAGADWLERAEREKEEGIADVMNHLPINAGSKIADIGAGTGYYSFRMAKRVPSGKVYAVELQNELISFLQQKVKTGDFQNVSVVKSSEQSPNLSDTSIDLAIMVDVYHELAYPREMLANILRALKPGGKLLLLEYKMEDPSIPIKELHKMSVAQADKEILNSGFLKDYFGNFLPIQHFLVYKKPL